MKKCPYCGEDIQDEVVKCPFCAAPIAGSKVLTNTEPCTECDAPVPVGRGFCPRCGVIQTRRGTARGPDKCPHCHSTQIGKISAAKKAGYVALLGIFAPLFKSVRSQFKCDACGHKW